MSVDIVTRLRNFDRNTPFAKSLADEGADEILRLRKVIANQGQDVPGEESEAREADFDRDVPTVEEGASETTDEVDRLRKAIAKHRQDVWGEDVPTHDADVALYSALK